MTETDQRNTDARERVPAVSDDADPFPPRLFLIGAQKAGTTSLAILLNRHPEIAFGKEKEPHFYSRNWARGLAWYRTNYPEPHAPWLLDASTSYAAGYLDPETGKQMPIAERIAATVSDPHFLFVLRDPVVRAWSAYWHEVRYLDERRPPEAALTADSGYIRQGLYDERLSDFIEHFSTSALLPLRFEEVAQDQQMVMDRICAFVGLESVTLDTTAVAKNAAFRYTPWMDAVRRLFPGSSFKTVIAGLKKATPPPLRPIAAKLVAHEIPPMPDQLKERLALIFEPHTRRLEEMLDMPFDDWTQPS